jgi:Mannosyltransferase putative
MQINLDDLYSQVNTTLANVSAPDYTQGKSIVTSIYNKEFASGYVLIRELVQLAVTLPIEIFYRLGELSTQQIDILHNIKPDQISVRAIKSAAKDFTTPYGTAAGWSTKISALLESQYAENLWLDSDSFPIRNPEFLFDDMDYQRTGSLFWRDVFSTDRANRYHDGAPFWRVFNVSPNDAEPFETGQLLIHKPRCWYQVNLVKHYADRCEIYYNFGGDAETFRMAWQHWHLRNGGTAYYLNYHSDANVPYGFMPFGPFHKGSANQYHKWGGGSVMVQRDRNGAELFNHRNLQKFAIDNNPFYNDIANEERYHGYIQDLRSLV